MKLVTSWSRKNDKEEFEHNHLEDGHANSIRPTPIHENHKKAWAKGIWKAHHGYLTFDIPPKLVLHDN